MGCDIHFYVERRESADAPWASADTWTPPKPGYGDAPYVDYDNSIYTGRNYSLFAILADVRNGMGFAGITTGEGFNPIAAPKGLPDDVTVPVKHAADAYGSDGHSHSWHSVADLLAYDWTQQTLHTGVLSAAEYFSWTLWGRRHGQGPKEYSGSVFGSAVRHIDEAEMEALIAPLRDGNTTSVEAVKKAHPELYTRCSWMLPYYKSCKTFLGETMPRLWRLGAPENVRIVFWFDN